MMTEREETKETTCAYNNTSYPVESSTIRASQLLIPGPEPLTNLLCAAEPSSPDVIIPFNYSQHLIPINAQNNVKTAVNDNGIGCSDNGIGNSDNGAGRSSGRHGGSGYSPQDPIILMTIYFE